jgi:penicillin V acylase-like amidase (Ntn superfamily)
VQWYQEGNYRLNAPAFPLASWPDGAAAPATMHLALSDAQGDSAIIE